MTAPAARSDLSFSRIDRGFTVLLVVCAVAYALFLGHYGSPHAGGADSSGYLNSAKLLRAGHFFGEVRVPAGHAHTDFSLGAFQPLGFAVERAHPRMAPTYPLGLPLHLVAAASIVGWDRAPLAVNVFAALASGAALWGLARHFKLSPAWSAVAVVWLWSSPQVIFCALEPMSDALAMTWTLLALWFALRSRAHAGWSLATGLAIALAVLVRPTNALIVLPILVAVGVAWPRLLGVAVGGLPGAVLLGFYNYHVYGAVLTTGYGNVLSSFSPEFVPAALANMGHWLPVLLSPVIVTALALPFLAGRWTRDAVVLALWTALLVTFYAFYFHTGETWWYLRFILPVFPLLILGALAVLARIRPATKWAQPAVLLAVAALVLGWNWRANRRLMPVAIAADEQTYRSSADWARANLPANSAVFCMQVSGAFYYYTDYLLVRWDQIEPGYIAPLLGVLHEEQRPVYAVLYEFEREDALKRIGGNWHKLAQVGAAGIWQRATP